RDSLSSLPKGHGWVWDPLHDIFKQIHFRDRETFDSSATPKVGQVIKPPKKIAEPDLNALKKRMSATIERQKSEDPRELRKTIEHLEGIDQPAIPGIEAALKNAVAGERVVSQAPPPRVAQPPVRAPQPKMGGPSKNTNGDFVFGDPVLPQGERKMLIAIAQHS